MREQNSRTQSLLCHSMGHSSMTIKVSSAALCPKYAHTMSDMRETRINIECNRSAQGIDDPVSRNMSGLHTMLNPAYSLIIAIVRWSSKYAHAIVPHTIASYPHKHWRFCTPVPQCRTQIYRKAISILMSAAPEICVPTLGAGYSDFRMSGGAGLSGLGLRLWLS